MTQYLAEAAREVAAVEIDKTLLPILDDTLKDWDNVTVINNDILKVDIRQLALEKIRASDRGCCQSAILHYYPDHHGIV